MIFLDSLSTNVESLPPFIDDIMAPILVQGLPSAGVVRTFPWPLVHGCNLHTEQTIVQVQQMLCILDTMDVTAFLIAPVAKLCIGTWSCRQTLWCPSHPGGHFSILDQTSLDYFAVLGYLFPYWNPWCFAPRVGDIEVMQLFLLQHGHHSLGELCYLNCCWLYLCAFWVSDLCNGSGEYIEYPVWHLHTPCPSGWLAKGGETVGCQLERLASLLIISAQSLLHTMLGNPTWPLATIGYSPWLVLWTSNRPYMVSCTNLLRVLLTNSSLHLQLVIPSHQYMVKRPLYGRS